MTMAAEEGTQGAVEQLRLRERLAKLRELPLLRGVGVSGEMARLQRQIERIGAEPSADEVWRAVELARHQDRPYTLDYVERIFEDFVELHGDRSLGDDAAIVAGLGRFDGRTVALVGHQKGRDIRERTQRNFGMTYPEGYRKAMRTMEVADRHGFPVVTLVDTPGAYPGDLLLRRDRRRARPGSHGVLQAGGAALHEGGGAAVLRGLDALENQEFPGTKINCVTMRNTNDDELSDFARSFAERNDHDLLRTLEDMNATIHREFAYEPGSTGLETTPWDVFRTRRGVCQDFANLFICLARLHHLPARYRVGYIHTGADYVETRQSEASHAWAEVYLPWYGWRGFDPTNGILSGLDHVRVACGRNYRDATPTSGTVFSGGGRETLEVAVRVEAREEEG